MKPHIQFRHGKRFNAAQACQMAIIDDPECNYYRKELERIELEEPTVVYTYIPFSPNGPQLKRVYSGVRKHSRDMLASALKTRIEEIKKIYGF